MIATEFTLDNYKDEISQVAYWMRNSIQNNGWDTSADYPLLAECIRNKQNGTFETGR